MTRKQNAISSKELSAARFWVKQELELKHLPILPEKVEERLFLEGRTAWNYKYSGLSTEQTKTSKTITFDVAVVLKKEFHQYSKPHRFKFTAISKYHSATHRLKVIEIARFMK